MPRKHDPRNPTKYLTLSAPLKSRVRVNSWSVSAQKNTIHETPRNNTKAKLDEPDRRRLMSVRVIELARHDTRSLTGAVRNDMALLTECEVRACVAAINIALLTECSSSGPSPVL